MPTSSGPGNESGQATITRVLVVEDNRDLAKLFCDLLEVMGCTAEAAFNARGALESMQRHPPDLVFCDLHLPGSKSGFDLAVELRGDPAFAQIPLIAVTGFADAPERERALRAGFDRVFEKPVKFAQMLDVLNAYRKS